VTDPIDSVEMRQSLASLAELTRAFYIGLMEEGFDNKQALALTTTWLRGVSTVPPSGGS
jgi:hypothetical protein